MAASITAVRVRSMRASMVVLDVTGDGCLMREGLSGPVTVRYRLVLQRRYRLVLYRVDEEPTMSTATVAATTEAPATGPRRRAEARRRTWILVAMCTALVAVVASVSGLNVAQQPARRRPRRHPEPAALGHQRLHDRPGRAAPAHRRHRRPLGPQARPHRRASSSSSPPTSAPPSPATVDAAAGLPGRRRRRRRHDHAGHPVGHHLDLPRRGARPGRRRVGRLRRRRRHPRPGHLVDRRRQLHLALGLRRPDRRGRASPSS